MDKIIINNLEIIANHGVFQEEKNIGQKFIISVEMKLSTRKAGVTDELQYSTHYGEVADDIEKLFTSKSNDLLEKCAEEIAEMILLKYRLVKEVKVSIKKPWAPIKKIFENVEIIIERKWNTCYLSLGTNIGDKNNNLNLAIDEIKKIENTKVEKITKFYETEPFGNTNQDMFTNIAMEVTTLLGAEELLDRVLEIENRLGRVRTKKWEPRVIDIDILLYNSDVFETEKLAVPHPWMADRMFVLEPLCEIAPNVIHPLEQKTIFNLKRELEKNIKLENKI
ncbi:MAG: 2-amino-4-hydroxy-6-hydroxymethyldihydropteridine diphosphokinase [Fusobacteriaceae bacterium]|nr:2-amino-4-hydroxy-6-hydroxymethyldihydropteridine diphosphokinase [Fusobacteriaceae bacterium]